MQLSPYLNFNGTCEEAMNFYKSIFGGSLEFTRFGDVQIPSHEMDANKIMNSTLKAGDISFMASDGGMGMITMGDSVNLALYGGPDEDQKMRAYFDGLSEGGTGMSPLAPMSWGADFGYFTDKFGINWMVNIDHGK